MVEPANTLTVLDDLPSIDHAALGEAVQTIDEERLEAQSGLSDSRLFRLVKVARIFSADSLDTRIDTMFG